MDGDWCRQAADWHLYCTKEFFSEGEGSRAIEKMGDRFRGKTTTRTVGLDYGATDILCHPVPIRAQVSMVAGPQLGKIYCILLAFDRTSLVLLILEYASATYSYLGWHGGTKTCWLMTGIKAL